MIFQYDLENVQNHKYPSVLSNHHTKGRKVETMADLALVLECKVLKESPVQTTMVKKPCILEVVIVLK
jgi:hypothetical protein